MAPVKAASEHFALKVKARTSIWICPCLKIANSLWLHFQDLYGVLFPVPSVRQKSNIGGAGGAHEYRIVVKM